MIGTSLSPYRLVEQLNQRWSTLAATASFLLALMAGCADPASQAVVLTADLPLHLEDHLDVATIEGSEVPVESVAPVEWHFDEPQSAWTPVEYPDGQTQPTPITYVDDALRLELTEAQRTTTGRLMGLISVNVPDHAFANWGRLLVRARSSDVRTTLHVAMNLYEQEGTPVGLAAMGMSASGAAPVIGDGAAHTYEFRIDRVDIDGGAADVPARLLDAPLRQIALRYLAGSPSSLDILSVTLTPPATYGDRTGVQTETVDGLTYHRALYAHAPGRIGFPVEVPEGGRFDVGLATAGQDSVTFRVRASSDGGDGELLLEETVSAVDTLVQRSVDLSHLAHRAVTLGLETDAQRAGTVALWLKPTVSGTRATERPNVVFYVIDGASADHMSVYGYNRRTTPNLERLAAEGVLFENAYSNATHTEASTPSFVTSLYTSVLLNPNSSELDAAVPEQGVSLAERLSAAGYQTALLTDNPNAGRWAGVERGADMFGDAYPQDATGLASSAALHRRYWSWRDAYPGEPYLIHFQTTDVHRPWASAEPFAGLFLPARVRQRAIARADQLLAIDEGPALADYERLGIDVAAHLSDVAALYDEVMAEQDYMLGQLVRRLRVEGAWDNTLLVIASDHGEWAGGVQDPLLNPYDPMFRSSVTRVPLLFIWSRGLEGGQRFSQPVSMIDVMPTILDLVGLSPPEIAQGQSLAPLMLGEEGWESRPVILDEFVLDPETGEPTGVIEVIDGRWGASLHVNPGARTYLQPGRTTPLLLFDLWEDPATLRSIHEERPDLVEHYTAFLQAQFEAHRDLAQFFTAPSGQAPVTPEELARLRALGYIR